MKYLRPSLVLLLLLTLLLGIVYPLIMVGIGGIFFPKRTSGSLIYRNDLKNREYGKEASQNLHAERVTIAREQGASERANFEEKPTSPETDSSNHFGITSQGKVIGSLWIAQNFKNPEYFHPRPSSAGESGYDAMNSGGSNLGPTSQKLFDLLQTRSIAYRTENNLSDKVLIPADAVTSSGSGLDPHISVGNAMLQASRIAVARGISEDKVKELIAKYTEGPTFGFLGKERINVLLINLALDRLSKE